jgi:DNA-binding XRE family transcriptional regulator
MGNPTMKFKDWHARQLARDPEYARAIAETNFAQRVADTVVEARIRAGLSQGELAQRAETTQARISELERGIGNPTLDTVARVMAALGVTAVPGEESSSLPVVFSVEAKHHAFTPTVNATVVVGTASGFMPLWVGDVQVQQVLPVPGFAPIKNAEEVASAANSELALAA